MDIIVGIYMAINVDGLMYESNQSGYTLTGYSNLPSSTLIIPSSIGNINVTIIGVGALDSSPVTSVYIPSTITAISKSAFYGSTNLTRVIFEDNSQLVTIGDYAFANCSVGNILLPRTVKNIGEYAFANCGNNNNISGCLPSLFSNTFANTKPVTVYINMSMRYYPEVQDTANVTYLVQFVIINGIEYIFDVPSRTYTLYSATNCEEGALIMTYINNLGQDGPVATINMNAFIKYPFTTVNIPYTVTNISQGAFSASTSLNQVVFGDNSQLVTIGDNAFANCNVQNILLPSTVESIGAYAFQNCGNNNNISNCTPSFVSTTFANTKPVTVFVNQKTYDDYDLGTGYTPNVTYRVYGSSNGNGSPIPIATICFVAGTLVKTDQGEFPIETLTRHTLRGKPIQVTQTRQLDPFIVKIKAHAFGSMPTRDTYVTKNHRIYQGSWVRAFDLVNGNTVTLWKHQGYLYNVLVDIHTSMSVHGMRVETLDPKEPTARLYPKKSTKMVRPSIKMIL